MKFEKLNHNLSSEKFVIDGTGAYWAVIKEVSDTENLPRTNLPIKIILNGVSEDINTWLDYLKESLFLGDDAEEILKIFKHESSIFSLKRIIFDHYGINFVFKNKQTKKSKEYVMDFIDHDKDPLTFVVTAKGQEIVFFRNKDRFELVEGDRMMYINGPGNYSVEILEN